VAFLAAAHLILLARAWWSVLVGQVLAVGAGLLGITAIYSTVYYLSFSGADEVGESSGIALSSALAMTLLSLGTVAVTPTQGIGGTLSGGTFGARMGRRPP
jgi:hypothetical protein